MPSDQRSHDVLVLGAGLAGSSAALAAREQGASVVIVEGRAEVGGNAPFSSGLMAFADTPLQREQGIADSPEAFVADIEAEIERQVPHFAPEFDLDLARSYAERTADAYGFMVELGFEFGRFVPRPLQHTTPRLTIVKQPVRFTEIFDAALRKRGVDVMLHTHADRLLTEDGRVVGAEVTPRNGPPIMLRADRSVVVALGGYQASAELRAKYQPTQDPRAPYPGLADAQGDGQMMLEAIGASLVNMKMIPRLVAGPSRFVEHTIAVNGYGERFEDEAGPYASRLDGLLAQPEAIGYYILDSVGAENVASLIAEMSQPAKRFATIAEVARAIGCEVDVLTKTLDRWNDTVESGRDRDPDFGRVIFPQPRRGISEPPFSVVPMVPGVGASIGGARVNQDMSVLDETGNPIPGLYAAGDSVGMINPATGLGGIHLSSAVTLGRVAGRCGAEAK